MKSQADREIDQLEYQIQDMKRRIAELRRLRSPERVADCRFLDGTGRERPLSSLFDGKKRLILIHNMGHGCAYCTMWADGFTGLLPHLESRAAFVLTSPDPPEVLGDFARSRGWTFPVVSTAGRTFADDMGFVDPAEGLMPGVSAFERDGEGTIYRVGRAEFGPGDVFCAVWHFFELFPGGADGWEPQFSYPELMVVEISRLP
jgi:predicted dithiol-disulfide oxidoreductase (DUF899 family)